MQAASACQDENANSGEGESPAAGHKIEKSRQNASSKLQSTCENFSSRKRDLKNQEKNLR